MPRKTSNPEPDPLIHVYPLNDTKRHTLTATGRCWCNPAQNPPVFPGVARLVVHNSQDEREWIEEQLNELMAEDKTWAHKRIG